MAENDLAVNLDEVYDFAIQLGKDAGHMLSEAAQLRFGGGPQTKHLEKESAVDIVTQTDEGQYVQSGKRLFRRQGSCRVSQK